MSGPLRFSAALRALEAAAVKRFGESGRHVTGYPDRSAKGMEKHLEIEEDGDRATASLGEAMMPLKLRRIDGKWRVDGRLFALRRPLPREPAADRFRSTAP